METQSQTSKAYFNSLTILFFAMLAAQIIMLIMSIYFAGLLGESATKELKNILLLVVSALTFNAFFTGQWLYKKRIAKARKYKNISPKMHLYRSGLIMRLTLLEAASLAAIVSFMLTAEILFAALTGLIVFYFLLLKPTRDKVSHELQLDASEKALLKDDRAVVAEHENMSD